MKIAHDVKSRKMRTHSVFCAGWYEVQTQAELEKHLGGSNIMEKRHRTYFFMYKKCAAKTPFATQEIV